MYKKAFTLVELLVVITIIAILIGLLLPSIGRSKAIANSAVDALNIKGQLQAAFIYAADNKGYISYNRSCNYGDHTVKYNTISQKDVYGPAGRDLWGLSEPLSQGLVYSGNPPTTATGVNKPLNLGSLIILKYASIDIFFSPPDKNSGNLMWQRRNYFGGTYANPWNLDGQPWSPYYGNSNYYFQGSYIYRNADWQVSSFGANDRVNGNTVGFANVKPQNLRVETEGFNKKTEIMGANGFYLYPLLGANVGFGDSSVKFWKNDFFILGVYNTESPFINQVGTSAYGGWKTLPLNAAEYFISLGR
jgi:prepilin-type N-terminal cleavage/methylation domain-containing protein